MRYIINRVIVWRANRRLQKMFNNSFQNWIEEELSIEEEYG
jgi:hypothetical protein